MRFNNQSMCERQQRHGGRRDDDQTKREYPVRHKNSRQLVLVLILLLALSGCIVV